MTDKLECATTVVVPYRKDIMADGLLVSCPRCSGNAYKLILNGSTHYWCEHCALSTTAKPELVEQLAAGVIAQIAVKVV